MRTLHPFIRFFIILSFVGLTACDNSRETAEETPQQQIEEANKKAVEEKKRHDEIVFWQNVNTELTKITSSNQNLSITTEWKRSPSGEIDYSFPPAQVVITNIDPSFDYMSPAGRYGVASFNTGFYSLQDSCEDVLLRQILDKGVPIVWAINTNETNRVAQATITLSSCTPANQQAVKEANQHAFNDYINEVRLKSDKEEQIQVFKDNNQIAAEQQLAIEQQKQNALQQQLQQQIQYQLQRHQDEVKRSQAEMRSQQLQMQADINRQRIEMENAQNEARILRAQQEAAKLHQPIN